MDKKIIEYYQHNTQSWMMEKRWNPITGCTKYSEACENCYAESMAKGFIKKGWAKCYPEEDPFKFMIHDGTNDKLESNKDRLDKSYRNDHPLTVKKPQRYFPVDMGDLFHEKVPFEIIQQIFDVMIKADQHLYLVLTKRSERMRELAPKLEWPEHIVAGVTVELPKYYHRINDLRAVPATTRMIMAEPLLSFLPNLDLTEIHQVVCGGESVPPELKSKLRPPHPDWVRDLRDQCVNAGVTFMFKQWGGTTRTKKANGCVLDGEVWNQWPEQIMAWHEARGFEKALEE